MGAPSPKLGRGGDLHSPMARLDFPSHSPIVHPNVPLYGPTLPQFPPSLPPPPEDGMSPLPPPIFRAQPLEALPDYRGSVGDPPPHPRPSVGPRWGGALGEEKLLLCGGCFSDANKRSAAAILGLLRGGGGGSGRIKAP